MWNGRKLGGGARFGLCADMVVIVFVLSLGSGQGYICGWGETDASFDVDKRKCGVAQNKKWADVVKTVFEVLDFSLG